jgi:hypothetical protein
LSCLSDFANAYCDKNNKEDNQKTLSISVLAVSKGLITEKNFADYYSYIDLNAKDNKGNNFSYFFFFKTENLQQNMQQHISQQPAFNLLEIM